jgi:hypothetical protein
MNEKNMARLPATSSGKHEPYGPALIGVNEQWQRDRHLASSTGRDHFAWAGLQANLTWIKEPTLARR